ncbi:unnamed protein product [Linum trigynum]|uniref:GRF-type domain-containing protein n=1 Tax=Linum trigynum TaxID=586398 RepID=A0AAV2F6K8_9ROSI
MSRQAGRISNQAPASSASGSSNTAKVRCEGHNAPCVVNTSRTEDNPGRKFYSCPFWKDVKEDCRFFRWVDGTSEYGIMEENEHLKLKMEALEGRLHKAEVKANRRKQEKLAMLEDLKKVTEEGNMCTTKSNDLVYCLCSHRPYCNGEFNCE